MWFKKTQCRVGLWWHIIITMTKMKGCKGNIMVVFGDNERNNEGEVYPHAPWRAQNGAVGKEGRDDVEHEWDIAGWWCGVPCCLVIGWKGVTCRVGRGRGRVPEGPTLLLSSSRARVRRSNCISCSRTEAKSDAAFSHCSIHTERKRTGLHTHTHVRRSSACTRVLKTERCAQGSPVEIYTENVKSNRAQQQWWWKRGFDCKHTIFWWKLPFGEFCKFWMSPR